MMHPVRRPRGGVAAMPRRVPAATEPLVAIAAAATTTVVIALAVAGIGILARRFAGSFAVPPAPAITWLVVAAGLAVMTAVDLAVGRRLAGRWVAALGRAGLLVAVLAMLPTVGPGSLMGLAAFVVAVGAALLPPPGATGWRTARSRPHRGGRSAAVGPPSVAPPRPAAELPGPGRPGTATGKPPLSDGYPGLRQRFERFTTAAGEDRVVGQVLVELTAGSRTGHAHVGFCPPFAALPAVEVATDYDGVEAIVTAAEVLPWGVRVECRLLEPAEEPVAIPVDLVARHPA